MSASAPLSWHIVILQAGTYNKTAVYNRFQLEVGGSSHPREIRVLDLGADG